MMAAQIVSLKSEGGHQDQVLEAARVLADGGLVAFPTETVYGLAANAGNESAVKRLRALKGITSDQPFTVHIGRRGDWSKFVPASSPLAERFIRKGWPGPLTLIFAVDEPGRAGVHRELCELGARSIYSEKNVSIRFPDHAVAERLLANSGVPVIASGANLPGEAAPTEAEPVIERLADKVDLILDCGATRYRKSSTVVALNGTGYKLLRAGVWDERTIRNFATTHILFVCSGNTCRSPMAEGLFKQMIAKKLGCREAELPSRGVVVRSAGTGASGGGRAAEEAVEVCRRRGVDITGHTPRRVSLELIHPADYIYTMSQHHAETLRSMAPSDAGKVLMLAGDEEISDPIGGSLDEYERVADRIVSALQQRLSEVPL